MPRLLGGVLLAKIKGTQLEGHASPGWTGPGASVGGFGVQELRAGQTDRDAVLWPPLPAFFLGVVQLQTLGLSLTHFELTPVCRVRQGSSFVLLHEEIPFSQGYLLKTSSFPFVFLSVLAPLLKIS